MSTTSSFTQLRDLHERESLATLLDELADQLRVARQYHELFEVLKLRLRHQLELPLLYDDSGDELGEATRDGLERGLLDACREVGTSFFLDGKPSDGWMYLRAIGNRKESAELLRQVEVTETGMDELIQVAVYEGVDTEYGFGLMLEHYGICNAITTYETVMPERSGSEQHAVAALLLNELYKDLMSNVASDREQRDGSAPEYQSLWELIDGHDELFEENAYHIDTSHLAAVTRFARTLDDPASLTKGWELSQYGQRLAEMYQQSDSPPFEDYYQSHGHIFAALIAKEATEVQAALDFFRTKAEQVDESSSMNNSREVYIDLLVRTDRGSDAIRETIRLYPDVIPRGLLSLLLEEVVRTGTYDELLDFAEQREDLLTYGTVLALRKQNSAQ